MKEVKCQHLNHHDKCYGENIYNKVGNEKRLALLNMVKVEGKSLKEAATVLNINYSTAKTILRVYRIENRILKKSPNQKKAKRKCKLYNRIYVPVSTEINFDNEKNYSNSTRTGKEINSKINLTEKSNILYSSTSLNNTIKKDEDDVIKHSDVYMNKFKILVSNLKVCIAEVMKNENVIKKVCNTLQNIPQFRFQSFDMPQAFPPNHFSFPDCSNFLNPAPMPLPNGFKK